MKTEKSKRLKGLLKIANEVELCTLLQEVTTELRNGRYRKVEVQHDILDIIAQHKPRVTKVTRDAYQGFVDVARAAASKNPVVVKKIKEFAETNKLDF